jgi:hypothetical protein
MFRWVLCCWRLCCALMHWLSETKYQSVIISAGVVDLLSSSLRRCERLSLILKLVFSLQRSYRFGLFVCAFTVRLVIRNKSHRYDCRVTAIESMIKFSVLLSANRVGFRHLPYALKLKSTGYIWPIGLRGPGPYNPFAWTFVEKTSAVQYLSTTCNRTSKLEPKS